MDYKNRSSFKEEKDKPDILNIIATIKMIRTDAINKPQLLQFDLKEIASKCPNSRYNPDRFPALLMQFKSPKTLSYIYSSGDITIRYARSIEECQTTAEYILKTIQEKLNLSHNTCMFENDNVRILNMVAKGNLGYSISFSDEKRELPKNCKKTTKNLIYQLDYTDEKKQIDKACLNLSQNGQFLISGITKTASVQLICEQAQQKMRYFQEVIL